MDICIYGAGAIGCLLAAKISKLPHNIYIKARGEHKNEIKKKGISYIHKSKKEIIKSNNIIVLEKVENIKKFDFIFVTLKANSIDESYKDLKYLSSLDTTFVSFINGIPHWYFYGNENEFKNYKFKCIDQNNNLYDLMPPSKTIGTVVYPSCEITSPGTVNHIDGNRFSIGEIDGTKSKRIILLSKLLTDAGFKAPIKSNIRDEIWYKLFGNLAFNPISTITGLTLDKICNDKELLRVVILMMNEAKNIADRINVKLILSIEKRIETVSKLKHKTSMLQDFERKKPLEIEAILGTVKELGDLTNISCPTINIVYNLLKYIEVSKTIRD